MRRAGALLVLLAALLVAPPAQAAFPGENGLIAFERTDYNAASGKAGADIWVKPMFSSSETNLTNSPGVSDIDPAWDSTGNLIAFASDRDGDLDIYLMQSNGSGVRQVTNGGGAERHPTWSPDSSKIAIESPNPDGGDGIWVVTVNGSEPIKPILPFGGGHPAWSPDGSKIAFAGDPVAPPSDPRRPLMLMNADGGNVVQLYEQATDPDWAPDGGEIAFTTWGLSPYNIYELYAIGPDGGGLRNLSNHGGNWDDSDLEPAWSPDGTKVAENRYYLVDDPRGGFDSVRYLSVTDAAGSGQEHPITPYVNQYAPGPRASDPSWQPVGEGQDPYTRPYPRPGSATPLHVPLVLAYGECTSPNSQHAAPLDQPSCTPAVPESPVLTMSRVGRGGGFARLNAMLGDPNTAADEADLSVNVRATDVLCATGQTAGCPGPVSDYSGQLLFTMGFRLTDLGHPFDDVGGTSEDVPSQSYRALRAPLDCTPTPGPAGSTCVLKTTTDSFVPGLAREGAHAVVSTLGIEVLDLGPDGTLDQHGGACPPYCSGTGDESTFLTQGIFTP